MTIIDMFRQKRIIIMTPIIICASDSVIAWVIMQKTILIKGVVVVIPLCFSYSYPCRPVIQLPIAASGPQVTIANSGSHVPIVVSGPQVLMVVSGPQLPIAASGPQLPISVGPPYFIYSSTPPIPTSIAGGQTPSQRTDALPPNVSTAAAETVRQEERICSSSDMYSIGKPVPQSYMSTLTA